VRVAALGVDYEAVSILLAAVACRTYYYFDNFENSDDFGMLDRRGRIYFRNKRWFLR